MTQTLTWQRITTAAFTLIALALVLYTLGAPDWTGG
ncbi:hypothetical protein ABIA33_007361 [Streptacidiphilus sp. MAP12-16]